MATNTSVVLSTNEVMEPSQSEINKVVNAIQELYSHRVMYFESRKIDESKFVYRNSEYTKVMKCEQIVREFKKYPTFRM